MEDPQSEEPLSMKFPTRINISVPLTVELDYSIRVLNRIITESGNMEISFQPGSPHIPHVTLLMGEVNDPKDYERLQTLCSDFAKGNRAFSYQVTPPYLKEPSKHFIFMNTLPQEHFHAFRMRLYGMIGGLLRCEYHGGPENPSHITIGYANPAYSDLKGLMKAFTDTRGRAEVIQICSVGNRGTCVDQLDVAKLG